MKPHSPVIEPTNASWSLRSSGLRKTSRKALPDSESRDRSWPIALSIARPLAFLKDEREDSRSVLRLGCEGTLRRSKIERRTTVSEHEDKKTDDEENKDVEGHNFGKANLGQPEDDKDVEGHNFGKANLGQPEDDKDVEGHNFGKANLGQPEDDKDVEGHQF